MPLGELEGPAEGTIELPVELFWSRPDRTFDVSDPGARDEMYEILLGQARRREDLVPYLNADVLMAFWPNLYNRHVRQVWESAVPQLQQIRAA